MLRAMPLPRYQENTQSYKKKTLRDSYKKMYILRKVTQLTKSPLLVKIEIAKYLDYYDIFSFSATANSADRYQLWRHLARPFEKSLENFLPRPYVKFDYQCAIGLEPDKIKEMHIVTRQRAASCIAPECADTKLYDQLYVPWDTFRSRACACKEKFLAISLSASVTAPAAYWEGFIKVVDDLNNFLLCIDSYSELNSGPIKSMLQHHVKTGQMLHKKWAAETLLEKDIEAVTDFDHFWF